MLQRIAVCCSVLPCVSGCGHQTYSIACVRVILLWIAIKRHAMRCVAVCCSVLQTQCAVRCSVLQCVADAVCIAYHFDTSDI